MKCPRCELKMVGDRYEGIEIEKCPGCHGFWVPGYRLSSIIEAREKTFSIEEIAEYRKLHEAHDSMVHTASEQIHCPECGALMDQSRYNYAAEVLIDRCPKGHGVWLDAGEIEHIQMAVEEEEDELQAVVAEKELKHDHFTSQILEHERNKYRLNFWHFFFWRSGS